MNRSKRLERSQYRRWFLSITLIALSILGLWTEGRTTHGHAPLSSDLEASSQIIYVNAAATGNNNGSSWANAFLSLQTALQSATSGKEIWVAAGVYKPTHTPGLRKEVFQLKDNVAIYGGFAGMETARGQRNWQINRTILSGDIDSNDGAQSGVVTDPTKIQGSNSFHVVSGSGVSATALLDGFTVTAGKADGGNTPICLDRCGGGMYSDNGSPTVANVTFIGNAAEEGAGMYNLNSSPALTNVTFSGNSASSGGGGMFNNHQSSPMLTNVTFSGNSAKYGGGIYNHNSSNPTLTNVTFNSNSAPHAGGGMYNGGSSPALANVTFSGNSSHQGGGMYNGGSSPALTNIIFSGNAAQSRGGGMFNNFQSSPTLTSVTFSGNSAVEHGGGIANMYYSSPAIRNSIFWHNKDKTGVGTFTASIYKDSSLPNDQSMSGFYRSLVQGCNPNGAWVSSCGKNEEGNLADSNPLFVESPDPAKAPSIAGNLRLQFGSPAVNQGNNVYNNSSVDLAGKVRIVDGTIDLGAYERVSPICPVGGGVRYVHSNASAPSDGLTWASAYRDLHDALQVTQPCQIWMAAGLYKPTDTAGNRTATFQLKNNVAIYGGFAGTETERGQRDWLVHHTILSGDIDNNDIAPSGIVASAGEIVGANSYHVVTGSGVNQTAVLDGVIITAGQANGAPDFYCNQRCGGGVFNVYGNPTLSNLVFSGNSAQESGGGIYNRNSSPSLTNVTFSGGMATRGGGMDNWDYSNPSLTNVVFSGNLASYNGGGMGNWDNSNPSLTNVVFSGNRASDHGGGMFNYGKSNPTVHNSIFWHNRADGVTGTAAASVQNDSSTPTFRYSLVQGCNPGGSWVSACGSNGSHNLADADPKFVETPNPAGAPTTAGNLRLQAGSPAIDKGDDNANNTNLDLAGNPRKAGNIDLGAYEYHSIIIGVSASPAAGGTVSGSGPVNHGATVTLQAMPNSGYNFVNWTEGSTVVSTNPSYSFTATASRTLVANFVLKSYTIVASANPADGGTVSGGGAVNHGDTVTLQATAKSGYNFVNWTEGSTVVSTNPSYSFTATVSRTLVANFTKMPASSHQIYLPLIRR
jgi:predicted outer membrane repeat protein